MDEYCIIHADHGADRITHQQLNTNFAYGIFALESHNVTAMLQPNVKVCDMNFVAYL